MIGMPPPSYYEKKFSQADVDVAVCKERDRCLGLISEILKDGVVAGSDEWAALAAVQVLIRDYEAD